MNVEKLESVYTWVTNLNLSRPIQNFAKDFSDAVLMAEIIAQFLPRYVTLANFRHVNSFALKRYNWETLQKVVLRHLKLQLSSEQIEKLANSEQGAIEWVLWEVKSRIEDAIKERRFRPSSRTSRASSTTRSASTSRAGSSTQLNLLDDLKEQYSFRNRLSSPSTSNNNEKENFIINEKIYNLRNNEKVLNDEINNKISQVLNKRNIPPPVLDSEFTNEQLIQKAYMRINYLENQLHKKDKKIDELNQQIQKLLEIICRRDSNLFQNNGNTGINTPASTSPKRMNHGLSSTSSIDLETEFRDFNLLLNKK